MEWRDPRKANQTFCSAKCYHHNVCGSARKGARNYTILKILRAKGPMTSKDIAYNLELFNTRGTSIRVANTLKNYTSKGAVFKEEYPSNKDSNVYFWTGNVEMHELFNPKS
jgi:hypothetical protein